MYVCMYVCDIHLYLQCTRVFLHVYLPTYLPSYLRKFKSVRPKTQILLSGLGIDFRGDSMVLSISCPPSAPLISLKAVPLLFIFTLLLVLLCLSALYRAITWQTAFLYLSIYLSIYDTYLLLSQLAIHILFISPFHSSITSPRLRLCPWVIIRTDQEYKISVHYYVLWDYSFTAEAWIFSHYTYYYHNLRTDKSVLLIRLVWQLVNYKAKNDWEYSPIHLIGVETGILERISSRNNL
jgi:hypothetical protein